jgi:hypothetical protein
VGTKKYDLKMKYLLRALVKSLEAKPLARTSTIEVDWDAYPLASPDSIKKTPELSQDYLWGVSTLYSLWSSSLY